MYRRLSFLFLTGLVAAQPQERPRLPAPDLADVRYGPHERNVLDVWLAKSPAPTPLAIYYHGGGFRAGDKRTLNVELLKLAEGMVRPVRFELTTSCSGGKRSIRTELRAQNRGLHR